MTDVTKLNSLEALAYLYADIASTETGVSFDDYIDNRYEDTFDIISRGVLKGYKKNLLGNNDAIEGIVLRTTPRTPQEPGPSGGTADQIISRNLGTVGTLNLMSARIMVLKTAHTKIFPVPGSYDSTLEDSLIIDNYPEFLYSPEHFPLIPGSWIYGQFNKNTFLTGVVTQLQPTAPYILTPVSTQKKSDLINGSAATIAEATLADADTAPISEVSQEHPPWKFPFNPARSGWNGYMLVGSGWGPRSISISSGMHRAFDIGCPTGTPYVALADGVVNRSRFHEDAGNYVDIRYEDPRDGHGGYVYVRYLHMNTGATVAAGENVVAGQVVGYAGTTGISTGPHLHMDIRPTKIYKPRNEGGINPGRFWPSSYYRRRFGGPGNYSVGPPIAAAAASVSLPAFLEDQ